MIVRLSSVGPLFRSGGFELSHSWSPFELDKLTEEQRATLRARYGRWIRVYPEDREAVEAHLQALDEADAKAATTTPTPTSKKAAKAGKES